MQTVLYGIPNCDTVRKARAWLDAAGIPYVFHDYKTMGVDDARLAKWEKVVGWETLLNKAGTTFRKLPDTQKQGLTRTRALLLMREQPSMIKRPVLERGARLQVGFSPDAYAAFRLID